MLSLGPIHFFISTAKSKMRTDPITSWSYHLLSKPPPLSAAERIMFFW